MRTFSRLVMLLAAGVLQATLPTAPWLGGMRPPLLLCVVLTDALTRKETPVGIALVAGLVQDSLGPVPLGFSSLCFLAAADLANRRRSLVFSAEGVTHVVFGAAAAALVTLAVYALMVFSGPFSLPLTRVALKAVGAAALGALCLPLVFRALDWMDGKLGNREPGHA